MKPLEFKIEEDEIGYHYNMIFYYEDKGTYEIRIDDIPAGLELNKHYSISDLYGYKVKDDREGL